MDLCPLQICRQLQDRCCPPQAHVVTESFCLHIKAALSVDFLLILCLQDLSVGPKQCQFSGSAGCSSCLGEVSANCDTLETVELK